MLAESAKACLSHWLSHLFPSLVDRYSVQSLHLCPSFVQWKQLMVLGGLDEFRIMYPQSAVRKIVRAPAPRRPPLPRKLLRLANSASSSLFSFITTISVISVSLVRRARTGSSKVSPLRILRLSKTPSKAESIPARRKVIK